MFFLKKIFYLIFVFLFINNTNAQQLIQENQKLKLFDKAETFNKKRFATVTASEVVLYTGTMIFLNEVWYKGFEKEPFHFFDDSKEWLQVDKVGHSFTGYLQGNYALQFYKWAGVNNKTATWLGGGVGFLNQTIIEFLDARSAAWGWSNSDILANTVGSALLISQGLAWEEQRILLKFGYSPIDYAAFNNTNIDAAVNKWFGKAANERVVKDYNAQTYWLSVNPSAFIKNEESKFPKWLNFAVGYGGEQMFHSTTNNSNEGINLQPYRQYYFGPDIDFTRLRVKNKALKSVLFVLNAFKFPLPAIEFNKVDGARIIPLAF